MLKAWSASAVLAAGLVASTAFAAASGFTSTDVAVIRYSIVTLAPTLRSPVTLVEPSRAISHRS